MAPRAPFRCVAEQTATVPRTPSSESRRHLSRRVAPHPGLGSRGDGIVICHAKSPTPAFAEERYKQV